MGDPLFKGMHCALLHTSCSSIALSRLNLVMQVSRQGVPSKDRQPYKADQNLAEWQGQVHTWASCVCYCWKAMLETNIVGLFVAVKTSEYYYYC